MNPEGVYGNYHSNMLIGYENSELIAEPVQAGHDFDLARVKEELSDTPMDCFNRGAAHNVSDVTPVPKVSPKVPGKRGRKPQLTAYGKHGEKLEKRREQNRRAAATYRDKQRHKRKTVEETYAELEADNARQRIENEKLLKIKNEYEAILLAHSQGHGQCYIFGNSTSIENNNTYLENNNTLNVPSDNSFCSGIPNLGQTSTVDSTSEMNFQNFRFQNPMMPLMPQEAAPQCTKDQSLAPSPYTPKSEQVFLFDSGWDAEKQKLVSSPPLRLNSPASDLSTSPTPEQGYMYAGSQTSVPLPGISAVLGTAQNTLENSYISSNGYYHEQAVDEFLLENLL